MSGLPVQEKMPGKPLGDSHPRRLGRYDVLRILGRGGMGTVFLGWDAEDDRLVALKVLGGQRQIRPDWEKRFQREIDALRQLDHPHVVRLFDAGRDRASSLHYYVMEFVDGRSLRRWVGRQASFRSVIRIIHRTALALGHIHDQGFIHRDVKPENILIDRAGQVKLTDFGIVKLIEVEDEQAAEQDPVLMLTQEGTTLGTRQYMAPEQLFGRDALTPAADVYALGVILYELVTGVRPHPNAPPLTRLIQGLPDWLDRLTNMMLALEPRRRFQDGKQIAAFLEANAAKETRDFPKVGVIPGVTPPRRKSRPIKVAVAAPDEPEESLEDALRKKVPRKPVGKDSAVVAGVPSRSDRGSQRGVLSEEDIQALLTRVEMEVVEETDDRLLLGGGLVADKPTTGSRVIPVARWTSAKVDKHPWYERRCHVCDGSGEEHRFGLYAKTCGLCEGSGWLKRTRESVLSERWGVGVLGGLSVLFLIWFAAVGFARLLDLWTPLQLFGEQPGPYFVGAGIAAFAALVLWGYDLLHGWRAWKPVWRPSADSTPFTLWQGWRRYGLRMLAVTVVLLGAVLLVSYL